MSATRTTAIIVGVVVGLGLIIGGVFAFRWFTAEPRGALDAREQILADGDFRIAAYDRFFGLCSAIQADEGRLDALERELAEDPSPDRRDQVRASITAVEASRTEKIHRYNADAAREYTVGQFRDHDLPFQIDPQSEETTCA